MTDSSSKGEPALHASMPWLHPSRLYDGDASLSPYKCAVCGQAATMLIPDAAALQRELSKAKSERGRVARTAYCDSHASGPSLATYRALEEAGLLPPYSHSVARGEVNLVGAGTVPMALSEKERGLIHIALVRLLGDWRNEPPSGGEPVVRELFALLRRFEVATGR